MSESRYDAAGNTLGYASNSYSFNQRGRMSQATVIGAATNYIYNALGQLIQKSGNGGTTLLMYDEAGHILSEYTGTGTLIQETIWMGDTPVATLQPNGSAVAIYYVHTDHLGTPRKITRPSDNGLMWRWDPDTFGSLAPNTNPAGLGTFTYNLRFPGQYALNESGLYYNYYRTYDPQMGRYIESDPIGLNGGINPYAYANGNPVSQTDPLGLYGGVIAAGGRLGNYYNVAPIVQLRLPDYLAFQLDVYVFSVSATYTRYGDIYFGKGAARQYPNPANYGVSISDGWMLNHTGCDEAPSRSQLNNFISSWSASAGAYALVGGSYSINANGQAFNLGVGAGGRGVSPGIINSYQGNIFGDPYQ